ncbi:hypothetical protein Dimus_015375 [Dionaea muscipula]
MQAPHSLLLMCDCHSRLVSGGFAHLTRRFHVFGVCLVQVQIGAFMESDGRLYEATDANKRLFGRLLDADRDKQAEAANRRHCESGDFQRAKQQTPITPLVARGL